MGYPDHFKLTDDIIAHLDAVLAATHDPFVESRYVGFLAVSAVTVYELAIKTIFLEFAQAKHQVLACFTAAFFERINGRIKVPNLRDDYISKYGDKYVKRFDKRLAALEATYLQSQGTSVKAAYTNVITWRNSFAHEGRVPVTATFAEVKRAYDVGKEVIHCLAQTMRR